MFSFISAISAMMSLHSNRTVTKEDTNSDFKNLKWWLGILAFSYLVLATGQAEPVRLLESRSSRPMWKIQQNTIDKERRKEKTFYNVENNLVGLRFYQYFPHKLSIKNNFFQKLHMVLFLMQMSLRIFLILFLEIGFFLCVALEQVLELALQTRLVLNSEICLPLPSECQD